MKNLKILNLDLTAPDQAFSLVRSKKKQTEKQIEAIYSVLKQDDINVILLHGKDCYSKGKILAEKMDYKFFGEKDDENSILLQNDNNCAGWFSIPEGGYRIVLPVWGEYLTIFSTSLSSRSGVDLHYFMNTYNDSKVRSGEYYTEHHLVGANFFEKLEMLYFCALNDMSFIDSNRYENKDLHSSCSGLLVSKDLEVESVCRYPILTDTKVLQKTPVAAVVKVK